MSYIKFSNPNYFRECHQNDNAGDGDHVIDFSSSQLQSVNSPMDTSSLGKASDFVFSDSDRTTSESTPFSSDRSFFQHEHEQTCRSDDIDDTENSVTADDESDVSRALITKDKNSLNVYACAPDAEHSGVDSTGRGIISYLSMLEKQANSYRPFHVSSPDCVDFTDAVQVPPSSTISNKCLEQSRPLNQDSHCVDDTVPLHTFIEAGSEDVNSPDSTDSGIQSDARRDNDASQVSAIQVSAMPVSSSNNNDKNSLTTTNTAVITTPEEEHGEGPSTEVDDLPTGWQRCDDDDGPYYWHVRTGTIQRDLPDPGPQEGPNMCSAASVRSFSLISDLSCSQRRASNLSTASSLSSSTDCHLKEFEGHALNYAAKSLLTLTAGNVEPGDGGCDLDSAPVRFAVRSLGWVIIAEDDLTPERSSKAVNKCIMDLSLGRHDINDTVGRWGDGKQVHMDIDNDGLRLLDPCNGTVLNYQPIRSVRVWCVGRGNGRDFAYVACDPEKCVHVCHVFRCESLAREIADTLHSICNRIMEDTGYQVVPGEPHDTTRPVDLPSGGSDQYLHCSALNPVSFPSPMEEPLNVVHCHYLGCHEVARPTGTDVINEAIEWMSCHVPVEKWMFVDVAIAPSTITISEHTNSQNILEECRVRFMSFMGISLSDVRRCAFIMHMARDKYMAHVLHCEPSAGPVCKTIEVACKLRYQKCLDAHPLVTKSSAQPLKVLVYM